MYLYFPFYNRQIIFDELAEEFYGRNEYSDNSPFGTKSDVSNCFSAIAENYSNAVTNLPLKK
jgi:hypothetical protein